MISYTEEADEERCESTGTYGSGIGNGKGRGRTNFLRLTAKNKAAPTFFKILILRRFDNPLVVSE